MLFSIHGEKHWPVTLAILICGISFHYGIEIPQQKADALLSASISLGAIFGGFLAGAIAILYALPKEGGIQQLIAAGYLEDIQNYLRSGIVTCITFCFISLIGFFSIAEKNLQIFSLIWIFFGILSLSSFSRISIILIKLLPHIYK